MNVLARSVVVRTTPRSLRNLATASEGDYLARKQAVLEHAKGQQDLVVAGCPR